METLNTQAPGPVTRSGGRTKRILAGAAAAASLVGAFTLVGATAQAGAAVSNNGVQLYYADQVGTTCTVGVGDEAWSNRWAQGAVSVFGCSYSYNIQSYVQLRYSSSPNGPFVPYTAWNYSDSVATSANDYTSTLCGGSGYFETVAEVSIGGAGYRTYDSRVNVNSYAPGSCSVGGYPTS